jgi:hypothetical protein
MKLYQFMPDELSAIGTQVMNNVVAQMRKEGDLPDGVAEKWRRRAIMIQEPSFLKKLFGKFLKDDPEDRLSIIVIERVTEDEPEPEGAPLPGEGKNAG